VWTHLAELFVMYVVDPIYSHCTINSFETSFGEL
jgi:hypothetical protein